jgi:hypothetical protein
MPNNVLAPPQGIGSIAVLIIIVLSGYPIARSE